MTVHKIWDDTAGEWVTVGEPNTDHGNLTGLTDDDHTHYTKADGTRAFTATVTGVAPTSDLHLATKKYVDDNADVVGPGSSTDHALVRWDGTTGKLVQNSGATLLDNGVMLLAGQIQAVDATIFKAGTASVSLYNTTDQDTDGGRSTTIVFAGDTAASAVHYLAAVKVSHDGTGADQQGKFVVSVNDTNDGFVPTDQLTITGVDGLALFAGEVRHPFAAQFESLNAAAQNFLQTAGALAVVVFAGSRVADTGFSWNSGTNVLTADVAGRIVIGYDIAVEQSVGTRGNFKTALHTDSGGGFALVEGTLRRAYYRATDLGNTISCRKLLTVAAGDEFKVMGRCVGDASSSVDVLDDGAVFWAHYVQGSS